MCRWKPRNPTCGVLKNTHHLTSRADMGTRESNLERTTNDAETSALEGEVGLASALARVCVDRTRQCLDRSSRCAATASCLNLVLRARYDGAAHVAHVLRCSVCILLKGPAALLLPRACHGPCSCTLPGYVHQNKNPSALIAPEASFCLSNLPVLLPGTISAHALTWSHGLSLYLNPAFRDVHHEYMTCFRP